jgi:hypothetical protein
VRPSDPYHPIYRHRKPRKVISEEEMRAAVQGAIEGAKVLRELDNKIQKQIIEIERLLWDHNFDAFDSGEYSYACRKGQWRFIRTSDRTPVLNLKRDERCSFLQSLVIPI